jgi:deoxynucleoside triphosphate triphosphohydrolase SAMHD1
MSDETFISATRKLQSEWYSEGSLKTAVGKAFDQIGFTEKYVDQQISLGHLRPSKSKAIKDSVWGMMEFNGAAMRLIDFSYLTYPTAEHSRFPHSIGMAHVVTKFISSIDRERELPIPKMDSGIDGYIKTVNLAPLKPFELVHAALLHDIGHLPFSHASESAIEASKNRFTFGGLSYDDFKVRAERRLKGTLSLSEALSILLVLSPRFGKFYCNYVQDNSDPEAIFRLAGLIAGKRISPICGNIQHIISSSSVDADKIDYINRDALACGVPVGVDVSRVFLGSSLIGIQKEKAESLGYSSNDRAVFAVNASGWDTYDEIIRARSMLYQRVYLHAVTRTAESLFTRALKLNAEPQTVDQSHTAKNLSDVIGIWSLVDQTILDELKASGLPEVSALSESLSNRYLPKKASAIGPDVISSQFPIEYILPKYFSGPDNVSKRREFLNQFATQIVQNFTKGKSHILDSVEFENDIIIESKKIIEAIKPRAPNLIPKDQLSHVAFIAIAGIDKKTPDSPIFQNGEVMNADALTNVSGVIDASDHFRQIGFVVSPVNWREVVSIATSVVLYKKSKEYQTTVIDISENDQVEQLRIHPLTILDIEAVVRRTGLSRDLLKQLYEELDEAGYFDQMPLLSAQTPTANLQRVIEKYGKFNGQLGWSVSRETVAAFINQFPIRFRNELVDALERGVFLDSNEVQSNISKVVQELMRNNKEDFVIVPLSPSSGGVTWARLRSSMKGMKRIEFKPNLTDALKNRKNNEIIVFVDDNSASGSQAKAQLYQLSGLPESDWPPSIRNETGIFREDLTQEHRSNILNLPFYIAVAVGHPTAKNALAECAKDLGFNGFCGLVFGQEIAANMTWSDELRAHLIEVGRDLVASDRWEADYNSLDNEKKNECDENAFGYGSFGGVTILPSTVPTSTFTALWMPGRVQGIPWMPLAIRDGRFRKLIFS